MFTDGGIVNSWSGADVYTGAKGLHVDVYEDKVVVKGRDYLNRAWIPAVRCTINLTSRYKYQDQVVK